MSRRKEKPIGLRLLSAVASFLLIGVGFYMFIAGVNFYSSSLMVTAILGLGIPSVISGDSLLDMLLGFFEAFLDGFLEVFGGIIEFLSSIFN